MATLLVVDDDPLVLSLSIRLLERAGHFILSAIEGAVAIVTFELHRPRIDAVVTDVLMPKVDGLTAFRAIRDRQPDVPFVFVTGSAEMLPAAVRAEPRVALLTKPFEAKDLVAAVDQVLAGVAAPTSPPTPVVRLPGSPTGDSLHPPMR